MESFDNDLQLSAPIFRHAKVIVQKLTPTDRFVIYVSVLLKSKNHKKVQLSHHFPPGLFSQCRVDMVTFLSILACRPCVYPGCQGRRPRRHGSWAQHLSAVDPHKGPRTPERGYLPVGAEQRQTVRAERQRMEPH